MKSICISLLLFLTIVSVSCRSHSGPLADTRYTDSLCKSYKPSSLEKLVSADLDFWQSRLNTSPGSFTAGSRLAGCLVQRFHLYGHIADLRRADSLLSALSAASNGNEAGLLRAMASLSITRHCFRQADSLVSMALAIGTEKYTSTLLQFDTRFELGETIPASRALLSCSATNEYGFFFRLAKWKHLQGETDSAAFYLGKALEWAGSSSLLRQSALSNIADLYMHEGRMEEAAPLYRQSLAIDASDWRSLQGLGRIALLHDGNSELAEKIFRFIAGRNELPDACYNLIWLAEQKKDSAATRLAAAAFAKKAEADCYGGMYRKYLVECYTGVLNDPSRALQLAAAELQNRATPQTYSWYAWCLYKTGEYDKALAIYKAHVSGKPLEALELYWMGKMMQGMKKPYNAQEFFHAANRNRYDLSPSKQSDLLSLIN
ncbi:MAG: tetratricopeptide repeat protein [Chitinophagaceae bacterium]|nr:tetratricopeptide repeat protein [Chitinophagaceae bacterium]